MFLLHWLIFPLGYILINKIFPVWADFSLVVLLEMVLKSGSGNIELVKIKNSNQGPEQSP